MGRVPEAAEEARRALAVAREVGLPGRRGDGPGRLGLRRFDAGDQGEAVRLARQAEQIPAGIPGPVARMCSYASGRAC